MNDFEGSICIFLKVEGLVKNRRDKTLVVILRHCFNYQSLLTTLYRIKEYQGKTHLTVHHSTWVPLI